MTDTQKFTAVFHRDIRSIKRNPHQVETPFGCAQIIGIGNVFAERDELADEVQTLREHLKQARDVLGRHHKLRLLSGKVKRQGFILDWIELDETAEYISSDLYERTTAFLTTPPPSPQEATMIKSSLKTDEALLEALRKAASHKMTPEELFEQKVSFVYGQMMDCAPHLTKDEVRQHLRAHYGMDTEE